MSAVTRILRGITNADMRRTVQRILADPEWEFAGMSGTTHGRLRYIPTGDVLTFGTTPGPSSWKTLATAAEKLSGTRYRESGSRRPGRASHHTDFDPTKAARQNERFRALGTDRTVLPERHADLVAQLMAINPRRHPERAVDIAAEICDLEARMDAAHIYYRKATA